MALRGRHLERAACGLTPAGRPLAPSARTRVDAIDVAHWIQDHIKKASCPAPMPQRIANPFAPNAPCRTPETTIIAIAIFRYLGFL